MALDNFESDQTTKKATGAAWQALDFVIDLIIKLVGVLIVSLFSLNPFFGNLTSNLLTKYKYEILKALGLILTTAMLIIFLIFNLFNQSNKSSQTPTGVDAGSQATDISGIKAKVLNIPYFNQWLEPDGQTAPQTPKIPIADGFWDLGNVICGAASSTMVAGFFSKLPFNKDDEHDLKRFSYSDQGMSLPTKCTDKLIGGAFGMTAFNSSCNQSSVAGMLSYFDQIGLVAKSNTGSPDFKTIKDSIDNSKPLIVSLSTFDGYGHIAVIKGYTEDGRLVMNDPWTDVQSGSRSYSYKGKNALYKQNLEGQGNFMYYLIVSNEKF